ncbi:MAG: nikR [Xanthobacteraceae bacterium]|jgi:CopG family nickel-responsive transcriptional regulator|nr:nikR [Xanthobacteraceae bacterium]MDF2809406.1 nikR [Microvirga sp.]
MHRTTIAIDDELAAALDAYMASVGAANRSEAIRDLVRRGLSARIDAPSEALCFGVVSCAIDQSVRNLATRVPQGRLDRHDETIAVLTAPLDHTTSIDLMLMRGRVGEVSAYAEALFTERGVLHGTLSLIPVAEERHSHAHPTGASREHRHLRVLSGF